MDTASGLTEEASRLLRESTIAIVGLHAAGSHAAYSLAAMGVGRLLCIGPLFSDVAAARIAEFPHTAVAAISTHTASDEELAAALESSTFAILAEPPTAALPHRVNRLAMRTGLRWTASHSSAFEVVLGPTIYPGQTACYVCYQMRAVACTDDPAAEFARLKSLEPDQQSSAAAGAGLLGHMLALEAVNVITGLGGSANNAIVVFDTSTMSSRRHELLRVPSCPICGGIGAYSKELGKRRPLSHLVSSRAGLIREIRDWQPPATAPLPPYLSQSVLSNFDFRKGSPSERSAAGKGWTREEAHRGAICEAVERYCASVYDSSALQFGPAINGVAAIEPSAFVLYTDRQYDARGFPFRRYVTGAALHWCRAFRLNSTPVLVPASETYLSFPSYTLGENFSLLTTTGVSAGETLDAAILSGLYECIERDAFVLHWMNRLTPVEVVLDGLPACEFVRGVFRRSGIDLHVFLIGTDIPVPVAMAVIVDRSGRIPAAAVGLGCHLSGSRAVERAVLEVCQVYASESGRAHTGPLTDPLRGYDQVRTLEDHGGFFSVPERLGEFDHLLTGAPRINGSALPETASGDASMDLAKVGAAVEAVGASVAFIDLTTPDLRDFPVKVVRTFAAGLQPIHFGFGWERLAGTRLYSIAQCLGHDTRIRTEADLNFCPHPLP